MVNGFEKLEKLFSGSRKKERGRRRPTHQKKVSNVHRQPYSKNGPIFPSPSYLRPTSMHMTPRQEQRDRWESEKGRSQSVPNAQEEARRCSSIGSSITIVDNARTSGDPNRPTKQTRDLHTTPVLSRFRFPEDSLFKNEEPGRMSGDTTLRGTSSEDSPCSNTAQATGERGLLDWTPKHISLLFDPLDLDISFGNQIKHVDDTAESLLLPSPIFISSTQLASENNSDRHHNPSTRPSSRQVGDSSTQKLTLFPRQKSLSPFHSPYMDSPPASESARDTTTVSLERSMSLSALSSPRADLTPRASVEIAPSGDMEDTIHKRSGRETWGNRSQDPRGSSHSPNSRDGILRSRLVRKSASIATLSIVTSRIIDDNTLKEPTFDDFYALSDDDIAESRPVTPAPNVSIPPTPPPKDNPIYHGEKQSYQEPLKTSNVQKPSFNSVSGEITPPCTPTDPQFLPLTYSPANPRDTLVAIRAAELAAKYKFAVVYVVSLWPGNGGNYLDPSRRTLSRSSPGKAHGQYAICHDQNSKIAGRLVAAYGLNEFPSPFEIVTDTHTDALNRNDWVEYRNDTTSSNDITRGWIRPYRRDHVAISSPIGSAKNSIYNCHVNRGIVFAAYVKKACNSTIPMKKSPQRDTILERLNTDAKALVDALIDGP
ncbi:hypothetical protein F5X99DRAFT_423695 [Biscogniauxia marginata]|nr:hypothetical protein F5X99DRAFT_423695 [Biscogniauxia marginata]